MWFKNLKVYALTSPVSLEPEALESALAEYAFRPCGSQETATMGFEAPFAGAGMRGAVALSHAVNGNYWICLKKQERLLPAAVVNAELAEKVAEIEAQTGSPVGKKAQTDLRQEIQTRLLPQAFTKNSYIHGFISTQHDLVIVNASADGQAEAFLAHVRKAISSLPVVPLIRSSLQGELTHWLSSKPPANFEVLEEAELKSINEDAAIIRCKNQDLSSDEIKHHIDAGKLVQKLAIEWDERINCVLQEDGSIKRVKFTDVVKEQNADIPKDEIAAKLDADFALMSGEVIALISALKEAFNVELDN
ncbi:recombination-associated protein RdgC [Alteromonas sp. ASW11-36]|uniref:Recombination-associated protein RdgC n=1 Tax=Alteromonas arenosi TaxID=3055817 RepID=A0ABT7SZY2_9ALTE|nr:recombination-associated protein RdgC [Alteromonas sp. ASW11-36]MDM7861748.1 recombination-associated protein RdgC [Alteromonas sp. ASW11-36]